MFTAAMMSWSLYWRNVSRDLPINLFSLVIWLIAAEASGLNLKGTWLVTLSACETGRGDVQSGEGVLGLRRAFIQAGAQNLLMTLWPANDAATSGFMEKFYEQAVQSGNAPEALAKVQTESLVKARDISGTKKVVQLYGPFIMSFQGAE